MQQSRLFLHRHWKPLLGAAVVGAVLTARTFKWE